MDESVDGQEDEIDCGEEWPDCANPDVPRYRKFYQVWRNDTAIDIIQPSSLLLLLLSLFQQSWTGVVQGIYPIERKGAVKVSPE